MNIKTKFDIGDVVYMGRASWTDDQVKCPSCDGSGWWTVVAHSGEFGHWQVTCQACKDYNNWGNDKGRGTVKRSGRTAEVSIMTIGSVRVDTTKEGDVEYMCKETGVGTGQIWKEKALHATRAEAQAFANQEVVDQLPDALKSDADRDERWRTDNMHHCGRPDRVETRKDSRGWRAWIQEVQEVSGYNTEKKAIVALAETMAKKL